MDRKLVYTKANSEEPADFEDKELEAAVKEKYDFDIGYMPEGYNLVLLLIKDDKEDSRKDVWKTIFFNKIEKFGEEETITLDNAEVMDESSKRTVIEFYKEIDGNFEDMVNLSVDMIKKYGNDEDKAS